MSIDHVDGELDGQRCKGDFFGRWSTYAHPVTPTQPLYREQVLLRRAFYRAWACGAGKAMRFVRFEAIGNDVSGLQGAKVSAKELVRPRFFELLNANGEPVGLGSEISASEAARLGSFGVRVEGDAAPLVVRQQVTYSYQYRYDPDGRLRTVTITNAEGKVSEPQY